jgi:tRNA(fMet)-specific endonuclease VapC
VYLIDSDILSLLQHGHEQVVARFESCAEVPVIASANFAEIMRGRCDRLLKAANSQELLTAQEWLDRSIAFLAQFQITPFDQTAAECFTRLDAIPAVHRIGRADVIIASVALANKAILVTRNRRHFSVVPGLTVENWAD